MQKTILPCLFGIMLALALPVHAGTADKPEIKDATKDGGIDQLDIQNVWVDTKDAGNLTFHLTVGADVPKFPHETAECNPQNANDCAFQSLSWRIIFRVMAPDGKPAPKLADYNRTYVNFRDGPTSGGLVSSIGYYDSKDVITLNGTADVTVAGKEIVFRLPRDNPAVNIPKGAMPGAYTIDRLFAYDSPQACVLPSLPTSGTVLCAPISKPYASAPPVPPAVPPATPSAGTASTWDRAPDEGYGNITVFDAPPAPVVSTTSSSSTSHTSTTTSTTTTSTTSTTSTTVEPTTTSTTAPPTVTTPTLVAKASPGLAVFGILGCVLGLALVRRRLA